MTKKALIIFLLTFLLTSCTPASTATLEPVTLKQTFSPTETWTVPPPASTNTSTPLPPTKTSTPTPIPFAESLDATVTADRLSCRYGPGPEYLYLFAFKAGARIQVIGRADNDWLLVENEPQRCWIHSKFVNIEGDLKTLKTMYPDGFKLIVSPYYGPTTVLKAERDGDKITVSWIDVPVSPGKYEHPDMFPYIIEVWRCENGEIIFEPMVSRFPFITFVDEHGCTEPSRGRVFVQEKHGYAGPADIPWPLKNK